MTIYNMVSELTMVERNEAHRTRVQRDPTRKCQETTFFNPLTTPQLCLDNALTDTKPLYYWSVLGWSTRTYVHP